MTSNIPSHSPASEDSLTGLMFEAYKKFLQGTSDMLPAKIIDYDRASNRAHVQPLIMVLTTSGERVARQGTASVPVFQMGGGGFMISFNLSAGDLGWIKSNDRDISLFLQSYSESEPNTKRLHSFEDAMFFPDVMRGYTIAGEDAGNLVIQNLSGSVRIALWPDKIKMTAPSVVIDSPAVAMTGTLDVDGMVTSGTDFTVGSITLKTHKHLGVTPGSGETGLPTA